MIEANPERLGFCIRKAPKADLRVIVHEVTVLDEKGLCAGGT
jgi:hypothetical protein